jgi:putative peptidoglycan lipid II flippase
VLLRTPITRILFERGQFTASDTIATAQALLWYAIGLAGFSGSRIAAQAFYAAGRPGIAVRLGVLSVGVNLVAAVALMYPLRHGGLAAASSIGAFVNLAALLWAARSHFGALGGRALARSIVRTLAACAPLAAWCGAAVWLWPTTPRLEIDAVWLLVAIIGAGALFVATAALLRAPELASLHRTLLRRRRD